MRHFGAESPILDIILGFLVILGSWPAIKSIIVWDTSSVAVIIPVLSISNVASQTDDKDSFSYWTLALLTIKFSTGRDQICYSGCGLCPLHLRCFRIYFFCANRNTCWVLAWDWNPFSKLNVLLQGLQESRPSDFRLCPLPLPLLAGVFPALLFESFMCNRAYECTTIPWKDMRVSGFVQSANRRCSIDLDLLGIYLAIGLQIKTCHCCLENKLWGKCNEKGRPDANCMKLVMQIQLQILDGEYSDESNDGLREKTAWILSFIACCEMWICIWNRLWASQIQFGATTSGFGTSIFPPES